MTALTANKDRPCQVPAAGISREIVPLAGYTNRGAGTVEFTVYKGAVVCCDISDTDGYFGPKDMNTATGDIFGGIALEKVKVTSDDTGDGSKELSVAVNGVWGFPVASLAITDIGATIYASDTDAVTTTSSNNLPIGILRRVDATYAWIDISDHVFKPAA